ncbi:hypothetical protein BH10PSE16_BH10PSE16_29800 [soil metagenome]
MDTNKQTNPQTRQSGQSGQPNGPAYAQQGQMEKPGGQPSQDSRFGHDESPGQQGRAQQGQEKSQLAREVSPVGQGSPSQSVGPTLLPPVDIYEDESGFTLMADMPGVAKEQLVVRVTGDNLLIEGAATVPLSGNIELVYGEAKTPQYRRSFTLSRELDPGKIEARLANGVLTLRIPKVEEARPRRIEVSVA